MQKIRLWEIKTDQKLTEIPNNEISLEKRLEEWLESDISVLDSDQDLLIIGKQVPTHYGGTIDLLCLDRDGGTVVVELKKGRTPREVTAQALDYASWVKDLSKDDLLAIANPYLKSKGWPSLDEAFLGKFETSLHDVLNNKHRSLIVAETMDESTERIIRYLADLNVPIDVATVQHFTDSKGKEFLAQAYLIQAEAKSQARSKRSSRNTLAELEAMADEDGIGDMYRQVRDGVQGILVARPYSKRVWYAKRLKDGRQRTLLIVRAVKEDDPGLPFIVHTSRFKDYLRIDPEDLRSWLPENTSKEDVTGWSGSSPEEREDAQGLSGYFQTTDEVNKFLKGLQEHTAQAGHLSEAP